jgi:2-methylcitrate dehydratase
MHSDATSSLAERLAVLVKGIRYDDLPQETVVATKRVLLDTLGCAIGAIGCKPAAIMLDLLPPADRDGSAATIIGSGRKTSAEGAALVNGTLVRYLDFMDVYWAKDVCHPSENIPPAIACIEEAGGGGKELLEAIVGAFEVQIRLADAFSFEDIGLHHVSAAGFIVPLIAGKAWGQTSLQMANGSTLAGASGLTLATLAVGDLSMAKAVGYARNSASAITAARAAGRGFTGPLQSYEWLLSNVGKTPGAGELSTEATGRWRIGDVSLKRYPIQYGLQAPAEAAAQLHAELKGKLDQIFGITVSVNTRQLARAADPAKFMPANRETADHSLPACVAMALCDGEVSEQQFDSGRYMDADVKNLISKTKAIGNDRFDREFAKGRPGSVDVQLTGGQRLSATVEVPFGDAARPFTQEVLEAKFRKLCQGKLSDRQTQAVIDCVSGMEKLTTLRPLLDAMKGDV